MVGSPISRRVSRHRRTASHLALRLIRAVSPIREAENRAACSRRWRDRRRRASAQFLRELKEFLGFPVQRHCRHPVPPAPQPEPPILASSGDSPDEGEHVPDRPDVEAVDLSGTFEELPNLDPLLRRATIQEAALRQAYIVLERLDDDLLLPQLPILPVTPPADLPFRWIGRSWSGIWRPVTSSSLSFRSSPRSCNLSPLLRRYTGH